MILVRNIAHELNSTATAVLMKFILGLIRQIELVMRYRLSVVLLEWFILPCMLLVNVVIDRMLLLLLLIEVRRRYYHASVVWVTIRCHKRLS